MTAPAARAFAPCVDVPTFGGCRLFPRHAGPFFAYHFVFHTRPLDSMQSLCKVDFQPRNPQSPANPVFIREPVMGFEPMTCCLRNSCSTPELHWLLEKRGRKLSQKCFRRQAAFHTAAPCRIERPIPPLAAGRAPWLCSRCELAGVQSFRRSGKIDFPRPGPRDTRKR